MLLNNCRKRNFLFDIITAQNKIHFLIPNEYPRHGTDRFLKVLNLGVPLAELHSCTSDGADSVPPRSSLTVNDGTLRRIGTTRRSKDFFALGIVRVSVRVVGLIKNMWPWDCVTPWPKAVPRGTLVNFIVTMLRTVGYWCNYTCTRIIRCSIVLR